MLTVVGITPLWRGINCAETRAVLLPLLQGASFLLYVDCDDDFIIYNNTTTIINKKNYNKKKKIKKKKKIII